MSRRNDDLARAAYEAAQRHAWKPLREALAKIDQLAKADAETIKTRLRAILGESDFVRARVSKMVSDTFEGSRAEREQAVTKSIIEAAKSAHGMDADIFKAIFEGDRNAAPPFAGARSNSEPRLRLLSKPASESEGE